MIRIGNGNNKLEVTVSSAITQHISKKLLHCEELFTKNHMRRIGKIRLWAQHSSVTQKKIA